MSPVFYKHLGFLLLSSSSSYTFLTYPPRRSAMRRFHPLITGTLLLTAVGFFCRILGFFYRIFLSRTIGAEGLGFISDDFFPIHGIAFALCAGPIQTSLSRLTAASPEKGRAFLRVSLALSLSIALPLTSLIYTFADFLAARVLLRPNVRRFCPHSPSRSPSARSMPAAAGIIMGSKRQSRHFHRWSSSASAFSPSC